MITRSRSFMIGVYILLATAGVLFFISPTNSILSAAQSESLSRTWGAFYFIGGITAASAVYSRLKHANTLATWFFEVAGLALLVIANLIYFTALLKLATSTENLSSLGSALVVLTLASSLSVRVGESLEIIMIIRRFDRQIEARKSRRAGE